MLQGHSPKQKKNQTPECESIQPISSWTVIYFSSHFFQATKLQLFSISFSTDSVASQVQIREERKKYYTNTACPSAEYLGSYNMG